MIAHAGPAATQATGTTSAPPVKRQRFNVRVRRGFTRVICELTEGIEFFDLLDPKSPWLRRFKGRDRKDAVAALRFMREQSTLPSPPRASSVAQPAAGSLLPRRSRPAAGVSSTSVSSTSVSSMSASSVTRQGGRRS